MIKAKILYVRSITDDICGPNEFCVGANVIHYFTCLISGDIGGSIGLFVGASVMTLFELIDLFTNFSARRFLR